MLYKQFRAKKDVLAKDSKQDVRERYGADASTQRPPEELLLMGQTERWAGQGNLCYQASWVRCAGVGPGTCMLCTPITSHAQDRLHICCGRGLNRQ